MGSDVGAANYDPDPCRNLKNSRSFTAGAVLGRLPSNTGAAKILKPIVGSLRGGARNPLVVKPDGTIMDGNTRVTVLNERGYETGALERSVIFRPQSEETR